MNDDTPGTDAGSPAAVLQYGEDLRAGMVFQLEAYRLTERELIDFASQWDPQQFHVNPEAAAAGAYHGLIASGIQTIAICQRLTVRRLFTRLATIAGRALRDVRFLRPLRPGDTLTGTVTIVAIDFDDRNRALVTTEARLVNQERKAVLELTLESYVVARRDPARVGA